MAVKHRKLIPKDEGNQTATCPDAYGCDPSYGDYLLPLPPQLPPPPPQTKPTKHALNVPTEISIAVALAVSFIILIICYLIIVKNIFGWIRRRPDQDPAAAGGESQEFVDGNRGPLIDHPIWYIRTIGLQPSVINTITIFRYKIGEKLIEGTDCSVCLNDFQEDETLRLLPKCNHAFHVHCIDTWLRSHTNCPLCRAAIFPTAAAPARSPNPGSGNELIQAENREGNEIETGNNENRVIVDEEEVEIQESDGDETGKIMEEMGNGNDSNLCSWSSTRRSFSVGSSSIGTRVDPEGSQMSEIGMNSRIERLKRSFSYGGRSFFSRN